LKRKKTFTVFKVPVLVDACRKQLGCQAANKKVKTTEFNYNLYQNRNAAIPPVVVRAPRLQRYFHRNEKGRQICLPFVSNANAVAFFEFLALQVFVEYQNIVNLYSIILLVETGTPFLNAGSNTILLAALIAFSVKPKGK
jgi:hypothetical protein